MKNKVKRTLHDICFFSILTFGSISAVSAATAQLIFQADTSESFAHSMAYDASTNRMYVGFANVFRAYDLDGTPSGDFRPFPGASSDEQGLHFLRSPLNLGGSNLSSGSLIAINGDDPSGVTIYSVDKNDGAISKQLDVTPLSDPIINIDHLSGRAYGIAHHPSRNTLFSIDWLAESIVEIDPLTGNAINAFIEPGFVFSDGDIAVHPITGNLFAVTSLGMIGEFSPDGRLLQQLNTSGTNSELGISLFPGAIAFDSTGERLWLLDGFFNNVYEVTGVSSVPIPASVYMFFSAIVFLFGIGKRKLFLSSRHR